MHAPLRFFTVVALAAACLLPLGCVSQSSTDDMREVLRQSRENEVELRARLEEAQTTIDALQQEIANRGGGDTTLLQQLDRAQQERDRLKQLLDDADRRLTEAGRPVGAQYIVLDPRTNEALVRLAEQHPDLMDYQPDRGMIKFRSDLTFGLGSTVVQPDAQDSLRQLAGVIGGVAKQYDIRIVGHTDTVPVTNPQNRAKYEDNWGLSAFRAKRVMEVLRDSGVAGDRLIIAGRGDTQPVVSNQGPRGAEANRRVEIYLVQSAAAEGAGGAGEPELTDAPVVDEPEGEVESK